MKKILLSALTICFLSASFFFLSCGGEEKVEEKYTTLSGTIQNFKSRSMTLKGFNYEKKIAFDRKTGSFTDTLTDIKPGHYTLVVSKKPIPLYITPDSKTDFTVDYKNRIENPVFTGENANINTYLSNRRKKFGLILVNANALFALQEDQFITKIDKYKSSLIDLVNSSQLPDDYKASELRNIDYELARNLNNYEQYYRILSGDEEYVASDKFPSNIVKNVSLNEGDDYVFSNQYRSFISERINNITNSKKPEGVDFDLFQLETIKNQITDSIIKNDLTFNVAEKSITYTNNLAEYYNKYMSYSTNPTHKAAITKTYEKLKLTARGMPSPKFVDYKNYKGGTTSFDDLIGHGKYLYVDVWATWCGFCKKEIPLLKRFEQEFEGENIEFVSINVDTKDKFNKWKETIEEKEMGGVQLFAGDKHENLPFTKDYLIKGLPRFLLIDPDGNIVTANAPRPSDGDKLVKILEALNISE